MKILWLILVSSACSARADSWVSLSISEKGLKAALTAMPEQFEEPIGVAAPVNVPGLGLEKGDVVLLVNGIGPSEWLDSADYGPAVVWLDVVRRGKPLVIRLEVRPEGFANTMERGAFSEVIQTLSTAMGRELTFEQATKAGRPSGVVLNARWDNIQPLNFGDVVRKVNGAEIRTIDELLAALDRAKDGPVVTIEIERAGQPIVATVQLTDGPAPSPRKATAGDGAAEIE